MSSNRCLLLWHNASFWQKSSHRYCHTQIHKWWLDRWMCVHGRKERRQGRWTRVCEWFYHPHSSAAGCVYHGLLRLLVVIPWWCGGWRLSRWQEKMLLKRMCVFITMSVCLCVDAKKPQLTAFFFWQVLSNGQTMKGKDRRCPADTDTHKQWAFVHLKQILKKKNLACISGAEHCPNVPELSSSSKGRRMQRMLWLFSS